MDNFADALLYAFFIFALLFLSGIFKAYIRKSPLSDKGEYLKYHKYLMKPAFWTFVAMFALVFGLGWLADSDLTQVAQKATVAGLYTTLCVYGFMTWGANLMRK